MLFIKAHATLFTTHSCYEPPRPCLGVIDDSADNLGLRNVTCFDTISCLAGLFEYGTHGRETSKPILRLMLGENSDDRYGSVDSQIDDDDERTFGPPSMHEPRVRRVLWIPIRFAQVDVRYLKMRTCYDWSISKAEGDVAHHAEESIHEYCNIFALRLRIQTKFMHLVDSVKGIGDLRTYARISRLRRTFMPFLQEIMRVIFWKVTRSSKVSNLVRKTFIFTTCFTFPRTTVARSITYHGTWSGTEPSSSLTSLVLEHIASLFTGAPWLLFVALIISTGHVLGSFKEPIPVWGTFMMAWCLGWSIINNDTSTSLSLSARYANPLPQSMTVSNAE